MITCKVCQEVLESLSAHVDHFLLKHKVGLRSQFSCGYVDCSVKLSYLEQYQNHAKAFHEGERSVPDASEVYYKCPHAGCNFKSRSKSSIRGHRFWSHPSSNVNSSDSSFPAGSADRNTPVENSETAGCADPAEEAFNTDVFNEISNSNDSGVVPNVTSNAECHYDTYFKKLVHMGLTMSYKLHVPDSTLGYVMDSYSTLIRGTTALTASELLDKLEAGGVNMNIAKPIVEETLSQNILNRLHCPSTGPMRSSYMRRQQYTNNKIFNSVSPVQRVLGRDQNNVICKYHYVPVKESIKWLMADDSVYEQYLESRQRIPVLQPDILSDLHDGTSFITHSLFSEDPSALQIIIYYDDVTLSKPLGPAASSCKISHFAFTLGNLKPWHRTKVDPIQLVMLCREQDISYFGLERVLSDLISDLKSLETEGLVIRGENIKASVALILGDNLACHTIGGFLESFSRTSYFCRYCEESRSEWLARWYSAAVDDNVSESEDESSSDDDSDESIGEDDPQSQNNDSDSDQADEYVSSDDEIPLAQLFPEPTIKKNVAPLRTEEAYKRCLEQLETHPSGVKGIVANSEFNKLKYYHCAGGMPGCIAHDYLEGIIAYDLILILKALRKKFKFSWEYLNRKLRLFCFQGSEKKDKPPGKFCTRRKKVKGNAVQIHVLLRFLPMILGKKVTNKQDPLWVMILRLSEIYMLVSSPSISRHSLDYIDKCILRYIHDRCTNFPSVKLRPKHHFVEHTKLLILKFGPPARTSTLKFESKHKFFRSEFSNKKNTVNPTMSMTMAHQFMQGSLRIDKLFENGVVMTNCVPFDEITDVELVEFLISMLGREFSSKLRFAHQVQFHNVEYKSNKLLVSSTKNHPEINLCRTILYASFRDVAYAIGRKCTARLNPEMQFYELGNSHELSLFNLKNLVDFTPYDSYKWLHSEVEGEERREEEQVDGDLTTSPSLDLVAKELFPFCDKQPIGTLETFKKFLTDLGVTNFSHLEIIDIDVLFLEHFTPVGIALLKQHLQAKKGNDATENTSTPLFSSIALNFNQIFSPTFVKKLEGTTLLMKDERTKVVRDVGDELMALTNRRVTEKMCKSAAKSLLSKFPQSLKPAPHTNGQLKLANQIYYHCNYKRKVAKRKNLLPSNNTARSNGLFSRRESYGLDPELDLPTEFPEGESAETMESQRVQLCNMFVSGTLNRAKMKATMKATYAAQRADINEKLTAYEFIGRWPYFGTYSVLEGHFFTLMKKDQDSFDTHFIEYIPKLAKYFEAEGNKKRKGDAALVSVKIRAIMAKYLKIKEKTDGHTMMAVILSALLKLEVPSNVLFLHLDETTSVDEIEASNKLPKDNRPIIVVLGNEDSLLLEETKCYVVVERVCICTDLTPLKALFASFMCYFIFKICYRTKAAPIMDFLQRAIYEIHDDEDKPHSSINRVERIKTAKGYTSAPLLVNRKYASMMQEVADFIDVWGL